MISKNGRLICGGGGGSSVEGPYYLPVGASAQSSGALTVSGGIRLDPSEYVAAGKTFTLTFVFCGYVDDEVTGTVTLYDLTNNTPVATLSVVTNSPSNFQSATMPVPEAAITCELRISHDGGPQQHLVQNSAVIRVDRS